MFGNGGNPFGALAMNDDQPSAGPSSQVIEGDEIDVDWVQLVKTNHDVNVRVSDTVDLGDLPNECNMMVVSNNWGLLIAASNTDVRIHRLSDFHNSLEGAAKDASPVSAPVQTISLSARPVWLRLAMNEERLVVATANGSGVHVFKLPDVLGGNTSPYHTFTSNIPTHLLDVLPNPAPSTDHLARYVALIANEGLVIADIEECKLAAPLAGPFTGASWSAKGKQILVGTPSGKLIQYTPEGVAKSEIPSPPDLESFYPTFVQWLENDLFFVSYAQTDSQPDDPIETYIIHRQKTAFTFAKFFDPLNTMGLAGRSGAYRHFAALKSWGNKTKHLAFVASGLASEIGVLHGNAAADKEAPKWEVLVLEETARGVLPAAKAGVRDDASVLGLALDVTPDKVIKQGIVGGIELPDLPPQPRLLAYTQEGVIISFDVRYPDAGTYSVMVQPQDIGNSASTSAPAQSQSSTMPTSAATPSASPAPAAAPSAFGSSSSAIGSASFGSTAFGGQTTTPTKPAGFGASAFGQPATSAFGSSAKPAAFGASAFGQSSTPTSSPASAVPSAFGSTSKPSAFGGFGSSSSPSAFGQSAFSQPSKPAAFGSSAFGSTPTTAPAKPPSSGQTSTPTAFGQSSTPTSAFGQSAFGQPSKPTSSTPSAFGSSTKPSAFGAPSTSSAFGSSTAPSAFGSSTTPSNPALGFGGFGSGGKPTSSTSSGFGFGAASAAQPAKPEEKKESATPAFGSGGSAFGSSSAFGSGSAFGSSSALGSSAFGRPNRSPSMETVQSAFTGHGSKSSSPERPSKVNGAGPKPAEDKPAPAFTGFGKKSEADQKSVSAFGGFGPKGDASKQASSFAGFGNQASASPSSEGSQSAFGSFGAKPAASTSSAFAGFGQPKPATPPVESPAVEADEDDFGLGGFASVLETSTKPAGLADSPPSSPVIGSNKPSGLEDDTPPNSPPVEPTPVQAPIARAPTVSSSFIKPATAFGGAPSSGFGTFGQNSTSKPTPAFGTGSALSSATTPTTPSAFGSSGFGKPSTIGGAAKPVFGGSAFGQSSVPTGSAFGQSSPLGNAKPFGSITGGFGGFGAKADGEKKPAGFGGFASTGTSVFGGTADKEKKAAKSTSIFAPTPPASAAVPTPPSAFASEPPIAAVEKDQKPPARFKEEVEANHVPEPAHDAGSPETTTPAVTPVKKPQNPESTTPSQAPADSTWPADAADSSNQVAETTTPPETPTKAAGAIETPRTDESKPEAPEPDTEEPTVKVDAASVGVLDNEQAEEQADAEADTREDHGENGEVEVEEEYDGEDGAVEEEYDGEENEEDYEDEEDYEEEEYDEGEYEEETDYHPQGRRRSSSVPPDMSPIKEELSDELASEDENEEAVENGDAEAEAGEGQEAGSPAATTRSLTKSPPAWFAKPVKAKAEDAGPVSPTPGSEGASLFARLSPAPTPSPLAKPADESQAPAIAAPTPVQSKPSSSFSFKHAARTSSPLAAPPSNAESTTPDSSPAKPPANAFSAFGTKSAQPDAAQNAPTPTPAFAGGLFGAKPAEVKPWSGSGNVDPTKPAATGGLNFFGTSASVPPKTESPPPLFGAVQPGLPTGNAFQTATISKAPKTDAPPGLFGGATPAPPPAEASKSAFGLGLGRPGSFVASTATPPSPAATPETKPAFSFVKPDSKPAVASASGTVGFGKFSPTTPSAPASAPTPAPEAPKPVASSKFTVPTRDAVQPAPGHPESAAKSMSSLVEQIIVTLSGDIQKYELQLKSVLEANARHHAAFTVSDFPKITSDNLTAHDTLPFSSVSDLTAIVEHLSGELAQLRSDDNASELKLAEVQSRMLKTDMKTGQADKFVKARQDPAFARAMQVKDLSPEQASSQVQLRKAIQVADSRLEELEASIAGLRRRVERHVQDRGAPQQPALERVQRSVRNIDAAIRDRQQTIDDLARRIGGIRVSSPDRSRAGSPTVSRTLATPKRPVVSASAGREGINLEPTTELLQAVESALNANADGEQGLASRLEKLKLARLTKPSSSKNSIVAHASLIKGPVMIDALPLPGQLPPPTPRVKQEPSATSVRPQGQDTPTPSGLGGSTSAPSPSFGGIKFSLDPGNVADLARSSSGPRGGSGGGGGASHRTHTPAAKFVPHANPSGSGSPQGGSAPGTSSLFAFKSEDKETKPAAPAGFFSFSGFDK